MTQRRAPGAMPIGAAFGLVAIGLVAGCTRPSPEQSATAPTPPPMVEPAPGAVGAAATGHAAILPPATGSITDEQVRAFVLSHRVPGTLEASNVAILSTNFISSHQVRALLHSAKLGVPDDEPMCVVLLSGKFVFSGPPGQTPTFPIGVEVFDARTGNLLQSGGLPRPPRAIQP